MNAQTKSLIVILATLLVGATIGALATSAIMNQRIEELQALRMEGGFMGLIERVIEPTDDAQRAEIRSVLEKAAKQQLEIRISMIEEHRSLFDELHTELDAILTTQQKERLSAFAEAERQRFFKGQPPPEFMPGFRGERRRRALPDSLMRGQRPPELMRMAPEQRQAFLDSMRRSGRPFRSLRSEFRDSMRALQQDSLSH